MFNNGYKHCPHFHRRHDDVEKIKRLEKGHENILRELGSISTFNQEQNLYLKKHMEEEVIQHKAVNNTLLGLNKAVESLITDKIERDESSEKRERFRDKVLSSVAIVVMVGLGKMLLDMYATTKVLGIE